MAPCRRFLALGFLSRERLHVRAIVLSIFLILQGLRIPAVLEIFPPRSSDNIVQPFEYCYCFVTHMILDHFPFILPLVFHTNIQVTYIPNLALSL